MKKIPMLFFVALLTVKMLACTESAVFDPTITLSPNEAIKMMGTADAMVIDVRSREEYATGHIDGAVNLPLDEITVDNMSVIAPDQGGKIIVYCYSGKRSVLAMNVLHDFGYTDIFNIGGLKDWPFDIGMD